MTHEQAKKRKRSRFFRQYLEHDYCFCRRCDPTRWFRRKYRNAPEIDVT